MESQDANSGDASERRDMQLNPDVSRVLELDEISRSRRLGELEVSNDDLRKGEKGEEIGQSLKDLKRRRRRKKS